MDHLWAANQLRIFVMKIDQLDELADGDLIERIAARETGGPSPSKAADELLRLDPVMRDIMNAARPGFGDYPSTKDASVDHYSATYWTEDVKPWALRALGVHDFGVEAREKLKPDSPDLVADQFHPWVWQAAAPLWDAGSRQASVLAAAQSVNARLQQKVRRYDLSDAKLCREAFSPNDATPDHHRLRFRGDQVSETWRSRQQGALDFGAGCFQAIRNPAAHEHSLKLTEQEALEQLAALSILARWIQECEIDIGFPGAIAPPKSGSGSKTGRL